MNFVRFTDPAMQAFTIDVPEGWQATGGTRHVGFGDIRIFARAVSPDGVIVQFRDPNLPQNFLHADGIGAVPGQLVPLPTGAQVMCLPYPTGVQFAEQYLMQTMSQGLHEVNIVGRQDRTDLSSARQKQGAATGYTWNAGEASFSARRGPEPVIGFCRAMTVLQPGFATFWVVEGMVSYLCSESRTAEAEEAAERMWTSVAPNARMAQLFQQDEQAMMANAQVAHQGQQNWFAAQQGFHQAQTGFGDAITQNYWSQQAHNEAMNNAWHQQQATYDDISANRSDATLERQRLFDPDTGQYHEAASGSPYYWRIHSTGEIVSADSHTPPDVAATPLHKVTGTDTKNPPQ